MLFHTGKVCKQALLQKALKPIHVKAEHEGARWAALAHPLMHVEGLSILTIYANGCFDITVHSH